MSAKWLFTFKHFKFPLLPLLTHSAMVHTADKIQKKVFWCGYEVAGKCLVAGTQHPVLSRVSSWLSWVELWSDWPPGCCHTYSAVLSLCQIGGEMAVSSSLILLLTVSPMVHSRSTFCCYAAQWGSQLLLLPTRRPPPYLCCRRHLATTCDAKHCVLYCSFVFSIVVLVRHQHRCRVLSHYIATIPPTSWFTAVK